MAVGCQLELAGYLGLKVQSILPSLRMAMYRKLGIAYSLPCGWSIAIHSVY